MKINVGTTHRNFQNIDTKGIRFEDLTYHLVYALIHDHQEETTDQGAYVINGWCPTNGKRGLRA